MSTTANDRREPPFSRTALILLVLTAVLRIVAQVQNATSNPTASPPLVDGALHESIAKSVAAGQWIQDAPFQRPPLYGYVTGVVYAFCGSIPFAVYALQGVLALVVLGALHRLVRNAAPDRVACVALASCALYGPLAFYELKFLPESLSVALTLGALSAWLRFERDGTRSQACFAGAWCGVLILDRPNLVFVPVFLATWAALLRRPRVPLPAMLLLAGTALGVAPAVVHNALAGDASVGVCAGGGLNFWLGNRAGAEASFTGGLEGAQDAGAMSAIARERFVGANAREPTSGAELERFFYREAFTAIASAPLEWAALEGRKLRALASEYDYEVNACYVAEREVIPALRVFVVPFGALLALGCVGLLLRPARTITLPRGPLVCVALAVVASALVFFVYARFRLPLVPVLAIGAALAIERIAEDVRDKRSIAVLATFTLIGLLAGFAWASPSPEAARQTSGGHALVGGAALSHRQYSVALAAYERALSAWPANTQAAAALTNLYLGKHDVDTAERVARAAIAETPDAALAYVALGLVHAARGRDAESDAAFAHALARADGDSVRPVLADYWRARGFDDRAREVLRR